MYLSRLLQAIHSKSMGYKRSITAVTWAYVVSIPVGSVLTASTSPNGFRLFPTAASYPRWFATQGLAFPRRAYRQRHCLAHTMVNMEEESSRKKVVFLGTPEVAASSLELLLQASRQGKGGGFDIVRAVSNPPARVGRKKVLQPCLVQALAESEGVPVMTPTSAKDERFLEELEELGPDLCITAAYGQFLPRRFLDIPKFGTLNVHPSLLPKYRGASPVQRCLEAGEPATGVTVAFTVLKMDAGPIVRQKSRLGDYRISLSTWRISGYRAHHEAPLLAALLTDRPDLVWWFTARLGVVVHGDYSCLYPPARLVGQPSLPMQLCEPNGQRWVGNDKLGYPLYYGVEVRELTGAEKAPELLMELFRQGTEELIDCLPSVWDGTVQKVPQDDAAAVKAAKLSIDEARCCFRTSSATQIHNKVRAFAGWPGTWALFSWGKGEQRKIKLITTAVGQPPAEADGDTAGVYSERGRRVVLRKDALELTCTDGSILRVLELQPLNKKVMGAKAFANGLRGEEIRWVEHEATEAVAAAG